MARHPSSAGQPFFDVLVIIAGDAQAAAPRAGKPPAGEEHAGDRGGQRPGKVNPPIGPVDARAGEHPPACPQCCQVDGELVESLLSAVGKVVIAVVEAACCPGSQQALAKLYPAPPGKVVVARPRLKQRTGGTMLTQRAN